MTEHRTRRDDIEEQLAVLRQETKRLPIHWTEARDHINAQIDDLLYEWEAAGA